MRSVTAEDVLMVRARTCARYVASFVLLAGCANPLDFFGVEERVVETETQQDDEDLKAGKNPSYDLGLTVVENFGGCDFLLNKSKSITRLSLQQLKGDDAALDGVLFPTRSAALDKLGSRNVLPSMEVVNAALRPFTDGLHAAVQLIAERGAKDALVNKRQVFDAVLEELLARIAADPSNDAARDAAADFAAARRIGGDSASDLPSDVDATVSDRLAAFEQDHFVSKPIGYYTWMPELQTIYRRDRFLMQATPTPASVSEVVDLLAKRPDLQSSYDDVVQSYAGMVQPANASTPIDVAKTDVDSDSSPAGYASGSKKMAAFLGTSPEFATGCNSGFRWLPPLASAEARLYERVACRGNPRSNNWMDALIQAIQSGDIDLTPTTQSGFYDRQLYALETLLLPERGSENQHLALTRAYKEKIIDSVKSVLSRSTETSAKQLFILNPSLFEWKSAYIYPRLPVEPFPTFYLRTARAYSFLRSFLSAVLGTAALDKTPRVLEGGKAAAVSISTELNAKVRLLYGLHILAASSLGMRSELTDEENSNVNKDAAEDEARRWLNSWRNDPDVLTDPRMIVPLTHDDQTATYWVVAGVKVLRMHASYLKGATPDNVASLCTVEGFVPFQPYMIVEQTLQVSRPASAPPLTQSEFRALADKNPTVNGLRTALGALP